MGKSLAGIEDIVYLVEIDLNGLLLTETGPKLSGLAGTVTGLL